MSLAELLGTYGQNYLDGLLATWSMTAVSFVFVMALAVLVTVMRVSPLRPLRLAGDLYVQVFRNIPGGGFWYLDEMISGRKLGVYSDQELKSKGLQLDFLHGGSPLQLIRMIPVSSAEGMNWMTRIEIEDFIRKEKKHVE